MAYRADAIGELKERRDRLDAKYDKELEKTLQAWIESTTGLPIGDNFQAGLKSGVILCNLMNKLEPGIVKKINPSSGLAFKEMENIGSFLSACSQYGVKRESLFQTPDLYEGMNMATVQMNLVAVKRVQEIKAKGGKVEVDIPKESFALQTKPREVEIKPKVNPNAKYYDHTGKEVVGSVAKPEASGRAGENTFGDLSDRRALIESKYNKTMEADHKAWIQSLTGENIGDDFQAGLKSGVILCKLANVLLPGSVKAVNAQSTLAFKQMENISNFLKACTEYGVKPSDLFTAPDLYENTNLYQVQQTLEQLRRIQELKGRGVAVAVERPKESAALSTSKVTDAPKYNAKK